MSRKKQHPHSKLDKASSAGRGKRGAHRKRVLKRLAYVAPVIILSFFLSPGAAAAFSGCNPENKSCNPTGGPCGPNP